MRAPGVLMPGLSSKESFLFATSSHITLQSLLTAIWPMDPSGKGGRVLVEEQNFMPIPGFSELKCALEQDPQALGLHIKV